MRNTYENYLFLYVFYIPASRRQLAGNSPATRGPDILAPAEDLDNKNPSLVALGNLSARTRERRRAGGGGEKFNYFLLVSAEGELRASCRRVAGEMPGYRKCTKTDCFL